ncbi:hypothetical protein S40288_06257 [Stachybotrys chartarum IBT 40288]|nr:hypothetical protein S40288_06257 [Stachybotrys chartarum IBT 40288]
MGDQDTKPEPDSVPEWQHTQTNADADADAADVPPVDLEVARRFLDDEQVKTASRQKKTEFLKSKGIPDAQIEALLAEVEEKPKAEVQSENDTQTTIPATENKEDTLLTTTNDRPPIVTYPEFLAKPSRPPPLVTTTGLLGTLNAFAVLSAAVYGASRFVVGPMVETLTDARVDFHDAASDKLSTLIAKLETTVSEIPVTKQAGGSDETSDVDDPAEMFHRDVGTQTVFPSAAPAAGVEQSEQSASQRQTERLSSLTKSLSRLRDAYMVEKENLQDIKTLVDVFRDDLDALTYGSRADFVTGYDTYGRRNQEPDDEIRKVRDSIRRVKGILLTSRSFPASTYR